MSFNNTSTLQSGATNAFSFRDHLLQRRQGKYSLPSAFLIRGDLLELYSDAIRGHNGGPMVIGDRKYRFTKDRETGCITASCIPKARPVRRRKAKTATKSAQTVSIRILRGKKSKTSKVASNVASRKVVVTRNISPVSTTEIVSKSVSMNDLDALVKTIIGNFPDRGSISTASFNKMLEKHNCKESFVEYSKRPNWISEGNNKCLVLRIPGKHNVFRLRPTTSGYQLVTIAGGIKQVQEKMSFLYLN